MIVIPTHACSADDGRLPASDVYGELDRDNVATCMLRVRWGSGERGPGCGSRIALCHGCGLRTRVNGAPCGTCGGEERPEVMRVHDRMVVAGKQSGEEAAELLPRDARRTGAGDDRGPVSNGARRPTEAKAPSKPRAPAKRVKKGPAAPDGPGLPFVK